MGRDDTDERGGSEFHRGLSFFDAIYGFAATILVANIDMPAPEAWQSLDALRDSGVVDQLFGFSLSFVVIAVFWRVNVRLVRRLTGMDGPTASANLLAAGLVILIPFTTQGLSDPGPGDLALPTAAYAVNVAAVSLSQTLMAQIAHVRGLERVPPTPREHRILILTALVIPAYFLASVPVALLIGSEAALLSWLGLLIIGPMSGRLASRAMESASREP